MEAFEKAKRKSVSMQSYDEAPRIQSPEADEAYFYTAGRFLSYNRPTKNGMVFFREDCLPVLGTIQNALSNVAHIKPGNEGAPDTYRLKNGVMGSILKYQEHPDGIDIVCKNDRNTVQAMGFKEDDFSPAGTFASYSQESEYTLANSPYIAVPLTKAKEEYFTPQDIVKTYSYSEGRQLGLQPSFYDPRTSSWKYSTDPEGNAVFVRLRPSSFTGVGHVIHPADTSAEIYQYAASEDVEEISTEIFRSNSGYITMDTPAMVTSPSNAGFGDDDFLQHQDLISPVQDISGYDLAYDTDAGQGADYDGEQDDLYLDNEDFTELKSFSKAFNDQDFDAQLGVVPGGKLDQLLDKLLQSQSAVKEPYGKNAKYADPGYRGDKKRYPLNTPEHVRAAATYWARAKNRSKYSPAQIKEIGGKIATAERKNKIGSFSNQSFAAVFTTPKEGEGHVVNRRLRMVDDSGNLNRSKLLSAYLILRGQRGDMSAVADMPAPVREHALNLVREGLKLTKPKKELSMNPNDVELNPHIQRELEDLRQRAQALSAEKDSAVALKQTEIEAVRQEFSQYKETNEALITELKGKIDTLTTELGTIQAKELSQERLATLEAIHPFSKEEKEKPDFTEFCKSLSQVSADRMEVFMVRRELAKAQSDKVRSLSHVTQNPTVSPAPVFEGLGKGLEISSPADIL